MGFSAKVDTFRVLATDTAGTTYARTGYGFQPKAVIVWTSGHSNVTDGVATANMRRSMGFGVSTSSRCAVFTQSQDNQGSAVADTGYRTDCILGTLSTAGAVDGLLDISSFDSDGITFVVDDQFPANTAIFVLALGGSDITDAYVGNFQFNNSATAHDITAPGFQPDCAFFLSGSWNDAIPAAFGWSQFSFGAATGATPVNAILWGGSEDGAAIMDTAGYCKAGECAVGVNADIGTLDIRAYVSAWISNGFTIAYNEQGLGGSGNYYVFYLALKGGKYYLGDLLTQTDTTTDIVENGVGFSPTAVLFASACRAQSTADTCTAHDEMSIGAATSPSARAAAGMVDEDNVTTSDVSIAGEFDEVYINLTLTSTVDGLMDVKSFDAGGFTCIMDNADPSQAFVWYVAFGPNASSVNYDRSIAMSVSPSLAIARASANSRGVSINDEALVAFARQAIVERTVAVDASSLINVSRTQASTRAIALSVAVSVALGRAQALTRALVATITQLIEFGRRLGQPRGLAWSASHAASLNRVTDLSRQLTSGITNTVAVQRSQALVRAVSLGNAIGAAFSRVLALGRAIPMSSGIATAVTTVLGTQRTIPLGMANAITLARQGSLGRAVASAIANNVATQRAGAFVRAFDTPAAISIAIAQGFVYSRSLAVNIGNAVNLAGSIALGRIVGIATGIGVAVSRAAANSRLLAWALGNTAIVTRSTGQARVAAWVGSAIMAISRQTGASRLMAAGTGLALSVARHVSNSRAMVWVAISALAVMRATGLQRQISVAGSNSLTFGLTADLRRAINTAIASLLGFIFQLSGVVLFYEPATIEGPGVGGGITGPSAAAAVSAPGQASSVDGPGMVGMIHAPAAAGGVRSK